MTNTQSEIFRLKHRFINSFGLEPNTILVAPNAEMELNASGIKLGTIFLGMRVVSADIADDVTVSLILTND